MALNAAMPSRRRFLRQLAMGSVLTGLSIAEAQAKVHKVYHHASHSSKAHKHVAHHHTKTTHHKSHHHAVHHPHHHEALHEAVEEQPIRQAYINRFVSHKTLALSNVNTGEHINVTYFEHGRYLPDALHEVNYLCRDYHTDTIHTVDPVLLDQLFDVKQLLTTSKPFQVISAYRSPYTNASLRHHSRRVAKHSLHMEGRAIDIRMEGVSSRTIKNAALALQRGGVGYYPYANFVHMDTGEFRVW
ncbi:hypothetical protein VZ94_15560 [Methylocucumis oryzae]|uniref:Murein endopeptidase K n=2 Tax=Methylocucumis oryzae TaxID=1632867 RepID=A0A0F3IGW8_9GAMM|nr:hypothetical protein VZ94_15560 [Methylocucumis oryzae]